MNQASFFPPFDPTEPPDAPYAYAQDVRIGDRVETSGQGGWDDAHAFPERLADEIVRAFDNLGRVLAGVSATWADVVGDESWHLSLDESVYAVMAAQLKERMPGHRPIWTALAVPGFGLAGMRVEIRVVAVI